VVFWAASDMIVAEIQYDVIDEEGRWLAGSGSEARFHAI
jgi:hypothetical protein